jgi:hypothetical protein
MHEHGPSGATLFPTVGGNKLLNEMQIIDGWIRGYLGRKPGLGFHENVVARKFIAHTEHYVWQIQPLQLHRPPIDFRIAIASVENSSKLGKPPYCSVSPFGAISCP